MDLNKVTHHLDVIKKCIKIIEDEIQGSPNIVVKASPNVNVRVNGQQVLKANEPSRHSATPPRAVVQTFETAQKIINDPDWPEAVPSDLLADETPEDMMARATGILESQVDRNLAGLTFLDYGCGDGYTIPAVLEKGVSEAAGYDIKRSSVWNTIASKRGYFTSNYSDLEPGSFDVILLYDVLDHAEKPQEVLEKVGDLLAPNGIVYVRCHPWTSRHGGHLYRTLNRAYIHLAVDDVHLRRMGYSVDHMRKVLRPLKHYKEIIQAAGFKVIRDHVKNDPLENFFRNNEVARKAILRHWDGERLRTPPLDDVKISHILEMEFVDYVLQRAGIF